MSRTGFTARLIGAVGVVYGDIGTSPIYAFREAVKPVSADGATAPEGLGFVFDVAGTTFFLGRRRIRAAGPAGPGRMLDDIHGFVSRLAADPSEYCHLPRNRVVESEERMAQ